MYPGTLFVPRHSSTAAPGLLRRSSTVAPGLLRHSSTAVPQLAGPVAGPVKILPQFESFYTLP